MCEAHFKDTVKRSENGQFIVSIPFKEPIDRLGDSKEQAVKRFLNLEKRLQANPNLRNQYIQFMREYETLGHMSKCEESNASEISYYMPHHGVLKEHSESTKLRVVFDASTPSTTGYSLNDLQMVGPTIQNDLLSIVLQFRKYIYGISSDIQMMYRMVWVESSQRSLQRILWREDPSKPLETYTLNTVTYGTASAPFLAIRSLFELSNQCSSQYPHISHIIKTQFYVDDYLGGADDIETAQCICKQLTDVLATAGFNLRKWISNEPAILKDIDESKLSSSILNIGPTSSTKTLGLTWMCQTDSLIYNVNNDPLITITKRSILSCTAQIFDPLGLLSPCIIQAKIIIQKLWLENLTWDEPVPDNIHAAWSKLQNELPLLNQIRIPRCAVCKNATEVELHGFSDACETSYGACIYLRSVDNDENVVVRLLCAKSKVAPLKAITIPRLELLGALMLARLFDKVKKSLEISLTKSVLWCDSTIVLGWITTQPYLLKPFVSNRISEIQTLTNPDSWCHVSTKMNPADLVSRGITPQKLESCSLWWNGPHWLSNLSYDQVKTTRFENLPELKQKNQKTSFVTTKTENPIVFKNYSNLAKLTRIIAYCQRFINNCRPSEKRRTDPLTPVELELSLKLLTMLSQQESFPDEYQCLSRGSHVQNRSKILNLNPFIDSEGILRVGGRLENSNFPYCKKHPAILCSKHIFTKLLFTQEHKRLLHAGPQLLLATIRERFWPIGGKNLAKKTVRECIRCFRCKPISTNPLMGNLPHSRLTLNYPFESCGVDYAGPLFVKDRRGRGGKTTKGYICLFICFAIKAIHIELVSDLSTESFIAALRRFAARRGRPSHIYSDNGKNFIGANKELEALGKFLQENENHLIDTAANEGIQWHFIPAYSPHFGGLWEAGVKSVKHHLLRVVGNSHLTYEDYLTLLVQIESILNSRPLCPISADPNDLSPLTPAHFLIGRTSTAIADPDVTHIPESRLSRFQRIQQLKQHFWLRWHKEYISNLQQRVKWKRNFQNLLKPGTLVLVRDPNLPPQKWQLGRVIELHPGADGIVRAVTIKLQHQTTRRAVKNLCALPLDDSA